MVESSCQSSPPYNLRTRSSSPVWPRQDTSDSDSTLVGVSHESSLDEAVTTVTGAENQASSRTDSEQDDHFRAIRSKRRKQRQRHQLCDEEEEEDSEREEVVRRCRKRKAVKLLSTSSDSEAGSDVLAMDKGSKVTTCMLPYIASNFLRTSSPKTGHSDCSSKEDRLSSLADRQGRGNFTTRHQQKCIHSLPTSSSNVRKRKRRMRQEDLFHFFPSSPDDTDGIDPLTLPPTPSSSQNRCSPSAIPESLPDSKSCVGNFVSTCGSSKIRKNKLARKLRPLRTSSQHNHQVSISSRPTLIAIAASHISLSMTSVDFPCQTVRLCHSRYIPHTFLLVRTIWFCGQFSSTKTVLHRNILCKDLYEVNASASCFCVRVGEPIFTLLLFIPVFVSFK